MSNSFYVSPPSSSPGNESASPVNAKPRLNETLLNRRSNRRPRVANGVFTRRNNRNTLESKQWGNTPFFTNAKTASMLERGWVRSRGELRVGQKGLYTVNDGPEAEVEVVEVANKAYPRRGKIYTFEYKSELVEADDENRYEEWDFYNATRARPFVPRRRGGRKRNTRRKA
jgi:hypothetical protein